MMCISLLIGSACRLDVATNALHLEIVVKHIQLRHHILQLIA